ncbi:DCC1-like thiol-disulfide oxidoreductase family protein [Phycisphaeraceae bacterium D3-23]
MKQLTVLYDPTCGLCVRCRQWLAKQPALIPLRFVPQGSRRQATLFPGFETKTDEQGRPEELVVIDDSGQVYRNDKAWVMCFYALREYRALSMRLARPGMAGLARRAYHLIAVNRRALSWLIGGGEDEVVERLQRAIDPPRCNNALDALRTAKEAAAKRYD